MALSKVSTVTGDTRQFMLSPQIKRYTLMDLGFIQTRNGNFQLQRPLDPNNPYHSAVNFKMSVAKDLQTFQMAVTTANGLRTVDIFKNARDQPFVEQYQYIISNLIDRQVLIIA